MSRDDMTPGRATGLVTDETPGPANVPTGVRERTPRRRRRWWALGAVLAALAALVVLGPWRGAADVRDGTDAVSREEMAARHGVDINLVAVTAARGLVELRMQVTDPDKASGILHDDADRPVIVAEDTGATLVMSSPPHHHGELELGGSYFFLLANAHNAVKEGAEVTLVIGDSRLEHLEVQG